MKRRDFLKRCSILPFIGSLVAVAQSGDSERNLTPSKNDYICAELQKHADYATQSAPFIQFWGVWFFADQNIIKYCPVNELRSDNWETIYIQDCWYDVFDYWQKIDGKIYWVGERNKWEILPTDIPDRPQFEIRWCGYWDGENWLESPLEA